MDQMFKDTRGFTLVELLVVVVIIAILSTVSLMLFRQYLDKARRTVSISALEELRKRMEAFSTEFGSYPPLFDFSTCSDAPSNGRAILPAVMCEQFRKDVFSVDSYTVTDTGYTLIAKAIDSTHSTVRLSSDQVVIVLP